MTEPTPVFDEAAAAKAESQEEIAAEDASDAQLRAWAKDNGVEGVPTSGRLSAVWRENIILAMTRALALDPKDAGTAQATTPTDSSTSSDTETETTSEEGLDKPAEVKLELPLEKPLATPVVEYRSVWEAPNTYVSSQTFTA